MCVRVCVRESACTAHRKQGKSASIYNIVDEREREKKKRAREKREKWKRVCERERRKEGERQDARHNEIERVQGAVNAYVASSLKVVFHKKSPVVSGSFAKRDLQLKTSYTSTPPCAVRRRCTGY